ncbi:MAG: DUF899 family protein [Candidatus Kapaibacterium sp.]|jgi:predicted dithiol-disulfide oxidoreductase (DUF899 family)
MATEQEIEKMEAELMELKKKIAESRRSLPAQPVKDYTLRGPYGEETKLSTLFGTKNELILIHNMGKKCTYCTLWADGINGFVKHLEDRSALVLSSPDDPETQSTFARDRGWTFRMVSTKGSSFTADMGFEPKPNTFNPGVSTFRKDESGNIFRVAKANFGPGDDYCSLWSLLDLLPASDPDWAPQYHY